MLSLIFPFNTLQGKYVFCPKQFCYIKRNKSTTIFCLGIWMCKFLFSCPFISSILLELVFEFCSGYIKTSITRKNIHEYIVIYLLMVLAVSLNNKNCDGLWERIATLQMRFTIFFSLPLICNYILTTCVLTKFRRT